MKKIIAFGASSSKQSINKQLANYTANQLSDCEVTLLDLNDFEMPIYSIDKEIENGIPELAHKFKAHLDTVDGFIISYAEHNGNVTAAYKNIYDWCSRIEGNVWQNKPMFLMATSPGGRGGIGALTIVFNTYSFSNSNTIAKFSLPKFSENFNPENGITNPELKSEFNQQLAEFEQAL